MNTTDMSRPPTPRDFRELSHRGPWTSLVDHAQIRDGLAQEITGAVRLVYEMTRSPASLQQISAMVGAMTLGQAIMVAAVVLDLEAAGDLTRMGEHHFTIPDGIAAALEEQETTIAFYRATEPITDRDYQEMSAEGPWTAILGEQNPTGPRRLTGPVLAAIDQITADSPESDQGATMTRIGTVLGVVTVRQGAVVASTVLRLVQAGVLARTETGGFTRVEIHD